MRVEADLGLGAAPGAAQDRRLGRVSGLLCGRVRGRLRAVAAAGRGRADRRLRGALGLGRLILALAPATPAARLVARLVARVLVDARLAPRGLALELVRPVALPLAVPARGTGAVARELVALDLHPAVVLEPPVEMSEEQQCEDEPSDRHV